jgi:hypothetical protein
MTDMDQLEMNFRAMAEPFGAADEQKLLARIDRTDPPALLPHVLPVQRPVSQGRAHSRDAIRYLSYADFYGQFALGREHFQAASGRGSRRAVQRLRLLPGAMPQRRPRGRAHDPRAGPVRVSAVCRAGGTATSGDCPPLRFHPHAGVPSEKFMAAEFETRPRPPQRSSQDSPEKPEVHPATNLLATYCNKGSGSTAVPCHQCFSGPS